MIFSVLYLALKDPLIHCFRLHFEKNFLVQLSYRKKKTAQEEILGLFDFSEFKEVDLFSVLSTDLQ